MWTRPEDLTTGDWNPTRRKENRVATIFEEIIVQFLKLVKKKNPHLGISVNPKQYK